MPTQGTGDFSCRIAAAVLAALAMFGWDWGSLHREDFIDLWELPTLAFLLVIAAILPRKVIVTPKFVPFGWLLAFACVGTFIVWVAEKGMMSYGGFDIGGALLRVIAYGLATYMFLPIRRKTNPLNSENSTNGT